MGFEPRDFSSTEALVPTPPVGAPDSTLFALIHLYLCLSVFICG
jgi:hypothetical protein